MTEQVYKDLLEVMKGRRGAYAGMDIPEFFEMVEFLFTPQEAEVNNALPRKPASAADIAKEMGRDENEIKEILEAMPTKGFVRFLLTTGFHFTRGCHSCPAYLSTCLCREESLRGINKLPGSCMLTKKHTSQPKARPR